MRTTITLLFVNVCASLFAQSPYRPFPESNAGWVESHAWLQPSGGCSDYTWNDCTRPVYFGADTMIDAITYHRLLQHGACNAQLIVPPLPLPPMCVYAWSYVEPQSTFAYIRQDVDERRVYIYDTNAEQERLLYDFTIGVGPYPDTYNNTMGDGLHVAALDSMELNDGWHRTWVLGTMWNGQLADSAFCKVIEGVGSTFGLAAPLWPPFENADALNCHSVDEFTVYPFGELVCDLTMDVHALQTRDITLHAFPNPASDLIAIRGELPARSRYVVRDALGDLVRSGALEQGSIDCRTWPMGVYAVTVLQANGAAAGTIRVVKE